MFRQRPAPKKKPEILKLSIKLEGEEVNFAAVLEHYRKLFLSKHTEVEAKKGALHQEVSKKGPISFDRLPKEVQPPEELSYLTESKRAPASPEPDTVDKGLLADKKDKKAKELLKLAAIIQAYERNPTKLTPERALQELIRALEKDIEPKNLEATNKFLSGLKAKTLGTQAYQDYAGLLQVCKQRLAVLQQIEKLVMQIPELIEKLKVKQSKKKDREEEFKEKLEVLTAIRTNYSALAMEKHEGVQAFRDLVNNKFESSNAVRGKGLASSLVQNLLAALNEELEHHRPAGAKSTVKNPKPQLGGYELME